MPVNRKLAAVVIADVAGYSRLMERDESGTHARLREIRETLIDPKITEHGGRTVHTSGDGMLLEFPSATSALRCAVEVQREMGVRNLYIAPDERIEFRFGINLGDVIVEGDDIIGDGVNVAARIETLAEPGGISVASAVWEQVHEDLGVEFVDSGEQHVKNISKPIRVFKVALGKGATTGAAVAEPAPMTAAGRVGGRRAAIVAIALVALVGIGTAIWHGFPRPGSPTANVDGEPPLRSVLVLPIETTADDPALVEAARRLTADLTRALGDSMNDVRVAPASVGAEWAGKAGDGRAAGRGANVRFLIVGDLRPAGTELALTLRLVDTRDGRQIQTERRTIERERLGDQEGLVRQFTSISRVMLTEAISRLASTPGRSSIASAQDLVDRALGLTISDPVAQARERRKLADEAIRLDPNLAIAWSERAVSNVELFLFDFGADDDRVLADADTDSLRAVTLDPRDALGWAVRGQILGLRGNFDGAFAANDRSRELDPTRFYAVLLRGYLYLLAGKPEETMKIVEVVQRGLGTTTSESYELACNAHVALGAYDAAIAACERAVTSGENWLILANLTAAYALRGDTEKAAQAKARLITLEPKLTIGRLRAKLGTRTPAALARDSAHLVVGLRKVGVLE
jgi:adenylate cyclase